MKKINLISDFRFQISNSGAFAKIRHLVNSLSFVKFTFAFFAVFLLLANTGCQPNQEILKSSRNDASNVQAPPLEPRKTSFEQDVNDIKDAGLDNIFVLRRKDGGAFDDEDKKYVRKNTPLETNRFVFSEESKALIIGAGFSLPLENVEALKKRFKFEDMSKPIEVEVRETENTNK